MECPNCEAPLEAWEDICGECHAYNLAVECAAYRQTLIVLSALPEVWRVINERHPGLLKGKPPECGEEDSG